MHKIAESPMNTGFLRLCIYTFRYFEKEKQKINSLKLRFLMRFQKRSCATPLPEGLPCKSDVAMFLPAGKAMYLRRDEPAAAMCLRRDFCPTGK